MKTLLKIFFTLFILQFTVCISAFAQNLVPNPSFEDTLACPDGLAEINYANGWINFGVTPDYYNACATSFVSVPNNCGGYQQPASGNAYAGLYTKELPNINGREYIGIKLADTLQIGNTYYISFKVNLSLGSVLKANCATNKLGALFTTYEFYYDGNPPNTPYYVKNFAHVFTNKLITDSSGWTTISDTVVADSAYLYLVIGNFFVDSLTSSLKYFDNGYSECASYYFIDDVYVGESPVAVSEISNENFVNIQYSESLISVEIHSFFSSEKNTVFKIYDLLGKQVFLKIFDDRNITININNLPKGMYIVYIQNSNKIYTQKIIK